MRLLRRMVCFYFRYVAVSSMCYHTSKSLQQSLSVVFSFYYFFQYVKERFAC